MRNKLKITFLGTGAADFYEKHVKYCKKEPCITLKKQGGKNIRRASSILVDNELLIDMSFDNIMLDSNKSIKYLAITHCHEDHFYPKSIVEFINKNKKEIQILGNDCIKASLKVAKEKLYNKNIIGNIDRKYKNIKVKKYIEYALGNIKLTAFPANHMIDDESFIVKQRAYNYIINKKGKKLIYALDTGPLLEESIVFLEGLNAEGIIIDSTFGILNDTNTLSGHHNFNMVYKTIEMMREKRIIKKDAKVLCSHISSHNNKATHEELQNVLDKNEFKLAYDGLEILI